MEMLEKASDKVNLTTIILDGSGIRNIFFYLQTTQVQTNVLFLFSDMLF